MRKINRLLAVASLLSTATAIPAQAADITYFGTEQVGSIFTSYEIETDGTLGKINTGEIIGFSATLTDSKGSFSFKTTGSVDAEDIVATAQTLTIGNDSDGLYFESTELANRAARGFLGFDANSIEASISDTLNGQRNETVSVPLGYAVATAPAVPEPVTWGMMILGFATIGFAMRCRRQEVSINYSFA